MWFYVVKWIIVKPWLFLRLELFQQNLQSLHPYSGSDMEVDYFDSDSQVVSITLATANPDPSNHKSI